MDETVERVLKIYQRHQMMQRIGMCCPEDHPCDTVVLFDEIKRLNGEIKALNVLVAGMALSGAE